MIVVIPMAGEGRRFAGYTFPKPLITIRNKPMIQWVVENLAMPWAKHIFVVRGEDYANYDLAGMVSQMCPSWEIVVQTEKTEGAAVTVLKGLEGQNLEQPLIIANCDQYLAWDPTHFWREACMGPKVDGAIPVFRSAHPKWSYAKVDRGLVTEVAEKRPISPYATCGVYYWARANDFRVCAKMMMDHESKRVNGEWYVAPVYNELLSLGCNVVPYDKLDMWGLGTPEDLEEFKIAVCAGRLP